MEASNQQQANQNLFNLLCADYEKGEIVLSKIYQYLDLTARPGHLFVHIHYEHKGTGQVVFDGIFEITQEFEQHLLANNGIVSFILTKLSDRLANNTFTEAEIANLNAMVAQAKAQELQQQKTEKALPFKQRMTNFLRRMT
jgi:hypothetical protein